MDTLPCRYPKPNIIPPRGPHTHSIILLHGRGDNGQDFGTFLITTKLTSPSPHKTLPERFPGLKFIFPTARTSQSEMFYRMPIPQWFDITSLNPPSEGKDLQHDGLRESAQLVHEIIDEEAEAVGIGNVIVGGLSQGAAQTLHVLLSYDDGGKGSLGGYVGMSGWLPFQEELMELIGNKVSQESGAGEAGGISNPSADPELSTQLNLPTLAVNFTRQSIHHIPPIKPDRNPGSVQTPIWLGHGDLDRTVKIKYGQEAATTMEKLGWDVTWKVYEELAHWYAPYELEDIATFLRDRVGVPEAV